MLPENLIPQLEDCLTCMLNQEVKLTASIVRNCGEEYHVIRSNSLTLKSEIEKLMFRDIHIKINVYFQTDSIILVCDFEYMHHNYGSNGLCFATLIYENGILIIN